MNSIARELRPTWFGPHDESSCIDIVALPQGMVRLAVGPAQPMARSAARLQLIRARPPRDHLPVLAQTRYSLTMPTEASRARGREAERWDWDLIMGACARGQGKQEFIEDLDAKFEEKYQEIWGSEGTWSPDKTFELINGIITEVGMEHFGKDTEQQQDEKYAEMTKSRLELLSIRRDFRETMRDTTSDEMEECIWKLKEITAWCKLHRKRLKKERDEELLEEIWEAWRGSEGKRDLARVNRLSLRLAGARYGPKKRDYRAVVGALPTKQEWLEKYSRAGGDGGMEASELDWDTWFSEKSISPFARSELGSINWLWKQDLRNFTRYVKYASHRRAVPKGSPPVELLRMALHPGENLGNGRAGLGLEGPSENLGKWTTDAIGIGFKHIRRVNRTPLRWHRSQAAVIWQGKKRREIHILDPFGKGWYAGRMRANGKREPRHYDHGFARGRRREAAIAVADTVGWRLRRSGYNYFDAFKDMSNAFASTNWESLDGAATKLLIDRDLQVGCQRHREAVMDLDSSEGVITLKLGTGALVGDPYAVASFVEAFDEPVERWWRRNC